MYAIAGIREVDFMVRQFQNSVMRIRYSSVPVAVCPHGRTLGGGCEMVMHADIAQAAAETYIGLVEVGVGLIPAGGGTKEFTKRLSDSIEEGDVELNALQNTFMNIATAKVALSAEDAREMEYCARQTESLLTAIASSWMQSQRCWSYSIRIYNAGTRNKHQGSGALGSCFVYGGCTGNAYGKFHFCTRSENSFKNCQRHVWRRFDTAANGQRTISIRS